MTATPTARGRREKPTGPRRADGAATSSENHPTLAPQRKLFVTLMIVLAVWVSVLLVLYFTTVRR